MSKSVLFMSMSLDGYIAGPNDEVGNPGGDDFMRLHEWYGDFSRPTGPVGQLWDEWNAPGAILAGRRTVEQVDHSVTITVSRSAYPVTGRPGHPLRIIRWSNT